MTFFFEKDRPRRASSLVPAARARHGLVVAFSIRRARLWQLDYHDPHDSTE